MTEHHALQRTIIVHVHIRAQRQPRYGSVSEAVTIKLYNCVFSFDSLHRQAEAILYERWHEFLLSSSSSSHHLALTPVRNLEIRQSFRTKQNDVGTTSVGEFADSEVFLVRSGGYVMTAVNPFFAPEKTRFIHSRRQNTLRGPD